MSYRDPWAKLSAAVFVVVSLILCLQAFSRPGKFAEIVFSDAGTPSLLLEASFPVFLVLFSPLLWLAWRKRSERFFTVSALALTVAIFISFDGFQIRRHREEEQQKLLHSAALFWSQGLQSQAIRQLTLALEENPEQPILAVRLAWMLAKSNQTEAAKKWVSTVDKESLPEFLLPTLQETRGAIASGPEIP